MPDALTGDENLGIEGGTPPHHLEGDPWDC
jgi:hypothetical protein